VSPASRARAQLEQVFRAALDAVDARSAVERAVVEGAAAGGDGELSICGEALAAGQRVRVLAVGKAAGAMAQAFERRARDRIEAGLAITKDGHGVELERFELRFAGHPVPDARSEAAAREAMAFVSSAAPDVATMVLLSGGASSLIACPAAGLSLADIAQTTAALLTAGADIAELNTVRKQLSAVGGGRLGRLARSKRVDVLAISDVPGDRLDLIGSGPFVADPATPADALAVVSRRGIAARLPAAVMAHLEAGESAQGAAPAGSLARGLCAA
jgi:glycerate 2-kinase